MQRLDTLAEVNPRTRLAPDDQEPLPTIMMRDVDGSTGKIVSSSPTSISEAGGLRLVREGDVLFAAISPALENGKVAVVEHLGGELALASAEFVVLRPRSGVSARWLWAFLRRAWIRGALRREQTGSTSRRRVPASAIGRLPVTLHTPAERARIVNLVEQTQECIELRRRALSLLRALPGAIVSEADGSREMVLQLAAVRRALGAAPSGVPLLAGDDLSDAVPADGSKRGVALAVGDLLVPRLRGDRTVRFYDGEPANAYAGSGVLVVRPNADVDPHFLWGCLSSASVTARIAAQQAADRQLRPGAVDEQAVVRPPLHEQRRLGRSVRMARLLTVAAEEQERQLLRLLTAVVERGFGDDVMAPKHAIPDIVARPLLSGVEPLLSAEQRAVWDAIVANGREPRPLTSLVASQRREHARHTVRLLERIGAVISDGTAGDVHAWRAVTEDDEDPIET